MKVSDAIKLLKQFPKDAEIFMVKDWISVEDELPKINHNDSEWEFSDDVIVYLKDGDIAVGRYERDNSIGEHYWVLYGVDKDLIVTHWMPLPAPPTSDKTSPVEKGGEQ